MNSLNNHIDLDRFVALGDSLTAGYKDAALFFEGQIHSYPKLMAHQFHCSFNQPLIDPNSVGVGFFGNSRLILEKENGESTSKISYLSPVGDLDAFSKNNYSLSGPFNNLGVPGAKVINAVASGYGDNNNGIGNYNPYFFRMASDPKKASLLSDALLLKPTFFSLFIGNNDVLAYAISGGTFDTVTPISGIAGVGFEESYRLIIDTLTSTGAKGVVCNLPGLHSIPLFNTIPYNALFIDASNQKLLQSKFEGFEFNIGYNAFIVEDNSEINGIRKIEKGELISLDILLDENKHNYITGILPIPKRYYLSTFDVKAIDTAIGNFNKVIRNISIEKELAFVDLNRLLNNMKVDRTYDGIGRFIKYRTDGVFALDGLHINSLGHALLANQFIKAINLTYGSDIKKVSLAKFRQRSKVKIN